MTAPLRAKGGWSHRPPVVTLFSILVWCWRVGAWSPGAGGVGVVEGNRRFGRRRALPLVLEGCCEFELVAEGIDGDAQYIRDAVLAGR